MQELKKNRLKKVGRTPLELIKRVCDRSYSVSSSKEKKGFSYILETVHSLKPIL